MFTPATALSAGMIDKEQTLEQLLRRAGAGSDSARAAAGGVGISAAAARARAVQVNEQT